MPTENQNRSFPVEFCRVLLLKSVRWGKAKWQGLNLKFWWWRFKGKENKCPDIPAFSAAENWKQRRQAIEKWRSDLNEYIDYQAYCHEILHQQSLRKINEEESFWKRLIKVRWFLVLVAGAISFGIFLYFKQKYFCTLAATSSAAFGTLISLCVSAPVLFFIWLFRDQNNRQQIESERKDINLKDFQKLAEWASGQHFTDKEKEQSKLEEDNATNHAISKHQGADSLQIAAIYQITTFLRGAYGVHFQRPAFQLLKSIWQAYVQTYVSKNPEPTLLNENENKLTTPDEWRERKEELQKWVEKLQQHMRLPLGLALQQGIFADSGLMLKLHKDDLPNSQFSGYSGVIPGLSPLKLASPQDNQDDLSGIIWQGSDLSGAELQGVYLSDANLQGANLFIAKLQDTNLSNANLQGADLGKANLQGADLSDANLQEANLSEAELQGADLFGAELQGADLSDAKLQGAHLIQANLQGADLGEANLQGAYLSEANLQGAYLSEANLQGAYLSEANLQGAYLSEANLQGAYLSEANLQDAYLYAANLQGSDFRNANLQGARLQGADLRYAKLQGADLRYAKLQVANLRLIEWDEKTQLSFTEIDETTQFGELRQNFLEQKQKQEEELRKKDDPSNQ